MVKILIVDDEPSISMLIEYNLRQAGFEVHCVMDGEAVFDAVPAFRPDLIILDLMLPKMDGIQVCRMLRQQNIYIPVIMLTALSDISDKIAGLDNGADDYMTKPFSPHELISRIQAVLRRLQTFAAGPNDSLEIGRLQIIPEQREIFVDGSPVELTPKEFELLLYLCKNRGKVMSREELLGKVWDYHFLNGTRIVDVHISHLRDKIESNPRSPEYIITVRNIGYKFTAPSVQQEALA